jgi:tight adherence protein C
VSPLHDPLALLACTLAGAGLGVIAWWVLRALAVEDLRQGDEWRYDVSRINALRQADPLYRILQPIVRGIGLLNRAAWGPRLLEVQREILAAGLPRYWLPEEFLAKQQILSLLISPAYFYMCYEYLEAPGLMLALLLTIVTMWWFRLRLTRMAQRRLLMIKRRLPFMLDLVTLLMEAGSSFLHALEQAVREFGDHPAAVEFGRVLADMNMGKARTEAFDNMRRRLNDDEIASIVGSIIQSEQLGTPLSHIFRTQADVLRVKRSQRAETIANEAGVQMLLPGILVMAATVLIILGPFLLGYLYNGFGL